METRLSSNRCSFGLIDSLAWRDEATRTTETIKFWRDNRRATSRFFKFVAGITQSTGGYVGKQRLVVVGNARRGVPACVSWIFTRNGTAPVPYAFSFAC